MPKGGSYVFTFRRSFLGNRRRNSFVLSLSTRGIRLDWTAENGLAKLHHEHRLYRNSDGGRLYLSRIFFDGAIAGPAGLVHDRRGNSLFPRRTVLPKGVANESLITTFLPDNGHRFARWPILFLI